LGKRTLIIMTTEIRRDIFQAIADPTRRKIIDIVSHQPVNLKTIADSFDISRPAISQQIKILHECGLVEIKREGRETFCSIQPQELKKIADWAGRYSRLWEDRINSFEAYVNKLHDKKNKGNGKSK
jgi:DNA-binding transcriptional ArsR family regulator